MSKWNPITLEEMLQHEGHPPELVRQILEMLVAIADFINPQLDTTCEEFVLVYRNTRKTWLLGAEQGGTPSPTGPIFPSTAIRLLVDQSKHPDLQVAPPVRQQFQVDWDVTMEQGKLIPSGTKTV